MDLLPRDMHRQIIRNLSPISLMYLKCTSKYWNDLIDLCSLIPQKEIRRLKTLWKLNAYNPLEQLLLANIDISRVIDIGNPIVTPKLAKKYNVPISPCITLNPLMTMEHLRELSTQNYLKYCKFRVCSTSNITVAELVANGVHIDWHASVNIMKMDDYLAHKDEISLSAFSMFGIITESDIINNPNIAWSYKYLIHNNCLSVKFLLQHFNATLGTNIREVEYQYAYINITPGAKLISRIIDDDDLYMLQPHMTPLFSRTMRFDDILRFPDAGWDWTIINSRTDISTQTRITYPNLPWNWHHKHLIVKLPENADHTHPWLRFQIKFENNTFTYDDILQNPRVNWIAPNIAKCKNISIETLLTSTFAKSYHVTQVILERDDITFDIICKFSYLKWELTTLCRKLEQYALNLMRE